ncbi:MAG: hypothetical protein SWX82_09765 [Cyanobacteriota bacterium]|nr:hypothetical protein [Cyanobacteriota bacterium]
MMRPSHRENIAAALAPLTLCFSFMSYHVRIISDEKTYPLASTVNLSIFPTPLLPMRKW